MPSISGVSTKGLERLFTSITLTQPRIDLVFPGTVLLLPNRVGFCYVIARTAGSKPQNYVTGGRLVYTPGNILIIPALSNFTGLIWTLDVDWNLSGLEWRVDYV